MKGNTIILRSVAVAAVAMLIFGCGGGGGGNKAAVSRGSGKAVFTIQWPTRASRYVPSAAVVCRVTIYDGTTELAHQDVVKPATIATFDQLPTGNLMAEAAAYPNLNPNPNSPQANGDNVAQSFKAKTPLLIEADKQTSLTLTMDSTINHFDVSFSAGFGELRHDQQVTLTATPRDSQGRTVLVNTTKITWALDAAYIRVDSTSGLSATITALKTTPGFVSLGTVQDTEAAKSDSVNATILPQIFVADRSTNSVVRANDLDGNGWVRLRPQQGGVDILNGPEGVVVDKLGHIWIADTGNNRIVRCDDMSGANFVYATTFDDGNTIVLPHCITTDSDGNLYVGSSGQLGSPSPRIVRVTGIDGATHTLTGSSEQVSLFADPLAISPGRFALLAYSTTLSVQDGFREMTVSNQSIRGSRGLASGRGELVVSDTGNNQLVLFTGSDTILYDAGGSFSGGFLAPMGLAFSDGDSSYYLADNGNRRVVQLTRNNFSTPAFSLGFSTLTSKAGGGDSLQDPVGVALF